jgi:branched-chain amino acid transport system ATP-binding protein
MTLLENVLTGRHARLKGNMVLDMLRFPVLAAERAASQQAMDVLRTLGIEQHAHRPVGGLPFGVQKLAGVARALAAEPDLLLLDEPAAGLAREEAEELAALLRRLREGMGIAVLLVEHNMRLVMAVSDRVVVLDGGRKLTEGSPWEVSQNPSVVEAYLGAGEEGRAGQEVRDELTHRS